MAREFPGTNENTYKVVRTFPCQCRWSGKCKQNWVLRSPRRLAAASHNNILVWMRRYLTFVSNAAAVPTAAAAAAPAFMVNCSEVVRVSDIFFSGKKREVICTISTTHLWLLPWCGGRDSQISHRPRVTSRHVLATHRHLTSMARLSTGHLTIFGSSETDLIG